jgi:hypothetical protein
MHQRLHVVDVDRNRILGMDDVMVDQAKVGPAQSVGERRPRLGIPVVEGENKTVVFPQHPRNTFQFYFSHFEKSVPADRLTALRQDLLTFNLFRESGEKTLTMEVVRPTDERLRQMYHFILDEPDRLINESTDTAPRQRLKAIA